MLFRSNSAPMTTSEGRNTNETITLNVGHSLKGLPTQPPVSRSEERRVGKSVDLGGRRIIKKKKKMEIKKK